MRARRGIEFKMKKVLGAGAALALSALFAAKAEAASLCFIESLNNGGAITNQAMVDAASCPSGDITLTLNKDEYLDILLDLSGDSQGVSGFDLQFEASGTSFNFGSGAVFECVGPDDTFVNGGQDDGGSTGIKSFALLGGGATCADQDVFGSTNCMQFSSSTGVTGTTGYGSLLGKLTKSRKWVIGRCHVKATAESTDGNIDWLVLGDDGDTFVLGEDGATGLVGDGAGSVTDNQGIVVEPVTCGTNPPTAVNASAAPVAGCTLSSGDSNITVTWTLPATSAACTDDSGATVACDSAPKVNVYRNGTSASTNETDGSFTELRTNSITNPGTPITYAVEAIGTYQGNVCTSSSQITDAVTPQCGDPPVPDIPDFPETALEDADADIEVVVSAKDAGTSYSQIELELWYWECSSYRDSDLSCDPTTDNREKKAPVAVGSDGKATLTIPGAAITDGKPVRYAVVATDTRTGLSSLTESVLPEGFDPTSADPEASHEAAVTCATSTVGCIAEVLKGTQLGFLKQPLPDMFPFQPTGGNKLTVDFQVNEQAIVEGRIYSLDGRLLRVLPDNSTASSVPLNGCNYKFGCAWDGTDFKGSGADHVVANGTYIFHVQALGTGKSFANQVLEKTGGIVVMH